MFGNIRVRSNHKSVERKFESSARNTLPIEIWLEIARYVEQDTKALRRLAQTDRITHNACIPLLYKTVFLYLQGIRETLQEFPPDRYLSYVKEFALNTSRESKSLRVRFFLFLVESRVKKMIHLEHVTLVYVQRVPPYLLRHIASLDTLRSVTINSCTLPQAPLRLRASLESLTLTLVEGNIVNFYNACRNSLKTLSLGGPLCTVLTKALYANPPPHLTKLEICQTRYLNVEALRSGIINECPTIIHLAISWLDGPLTVPANALPRLEILEIPLHCVSDIVPGRPVHTYDQTGGIRWNDTITPALQALRHSTSHITVLRLCVGNLDASLVILNGIEPLVSALRVLQLDSCDVYYNSVHLLVPILLQACTLQTLAIDSLQRSARSRRWSDDMNQAVLFGWLCTQACKELSDLSFVVHDRPLSGFEMRRVTREEWRFQPLLSVFVGPQDVGGMQESYRLIGRSLSRLVG